MEVETWFGPATSQGTLDASVMSVYRKMLDRVSSSTYVCAPYDTNGCNGNVFAYVYPKDPVQSIYMCKITFDYPVTLAYSCPLLSMPVLQDYAEKVQTIVHELSNTNRFNRVR